MSHWGHRRHCSLTTFSLWKSTEPRGAPRERSQGPKKNPKSQKIARDAPKNCLNNSWALPSKTRFLRQIAPESSAKSWSHKFFGVPFLSLKVSQLAVLLLPKPSQSQKAMGRDPLQLAPFAAHTSSPNKVP